jgi:hypothetical protein
LTMTCQSCLRCLRPYPRRLRSTGWITASDQSSFDRKWCTVESNIPNPDTAPVQRAPPGVTYPPPPLLTGPITNPAPPSGLQVPGTSASIPSLYIAVVIAVLLCICYCWWRRRRRRAACNRNRKRRRSKYKPASHDNDVDDDSSQGSGHAAYLDDADEYSDAEAEVEEVAPKRQRRKQRETSPERKRSRIKPATPRRSGAQAAAPPSRKRNASPPRAAVMEPAAARKKRGSQRIPVPPDKRQGRAGRVRGPGRIKAGEQRTEELARPLDAVRPHRSNRGRSKQHKEPNESFHGL